MRWTLAHRFDKRCVALADRHYSRRKVGSPQFVPPGSPVVLYAPGAVWCSLQQLSSMHQWWPSWGNPIFRKECEGLASEFIREALAATRWCWGLPPEPWGMVTFVDAAKVRHKRDPGRCFRRAGWTDDGLTTKGLVRLIAPGGDQ